MINPSSFYYYSTNYFVFSIFRTFVFFMTRVLDVHNYLQKYFFILRFNKMSIQIEIFFYINYTKKK